MLWRVGRGSRQSLHQQVHSLADLFVPLSLRTSHLCPSLSLACPRSFTLPRRKVRPVPALRDYADQNTSEGHIPNTVRVTKHQSTAPPIHNHPSEHVAVIGLSHPRPSATHVAENELTIVADRDLFRAFSDSRKVSRLVQRILSTHPHKAPLVLVAAHRYGCHLGKEVYETAACRFAKAREWRLIPTLALLQKRQLGRRTPRLLNWHIRALVEMSQFARLDRALGWFEEEGLSPSQRTYHLLLSGHLRNRNIVKAMDVIQQMLQAGFNIDARTHATVVSVYRTLGPDVVVQTRALDALKDADPNTSTRILNALLKFSIDTRDIERVSLLIRHFDFGTFDVPRLSLGACPLRRGGEDATLSEFIRSSSLDHASRRIPPDIATYTILLPYIASQGDLVSVRGLLGQMAHSSLTPDSRFIAALIRFYFVIDQPSAAIGVVSAMCKDVKGLRAVLESIHLSFEPQEGLPIPHVLPKPTAEILNALATGLLRLRGIDGLQACLRLMQMCQVNPDHHTKALLETHLIHTEGCSAADVTRVCKEFSLNDRSLSRLSRLLASGFQCHFRSAKRSGWNNTLPGKRSHFRTQSPSHLTRKSAMGKLFDPTAGIQPVPTHQTTRIRSIIQSLADRGVLSDHRIFALRIRYEAVIKGDMRTAKNVFQTMLDRGLHPNEYHYAALMEGYAATGELAAAEAVMNAAERAGIRPNCVMHTILIVGYARRKNPEQVMRILRHMVAVGVRPDVPAIEAITSLWPSVAPLPHDFERASLELLVSHFRNLHEVHVSLKPSDREPRELIGKLKELSRTWLLMEKSRADWQGDLGHGTLSS
ncbi:hypothetical protein BC826DRAFT_24234 [Russula brevipes]|nr:hypothetical protein BC826DRAFT_24234 [Russula brevipes]